MNLKRTRIDLLIDKEGKEPPVLPVESTYKAYTGKKDFRGMGSTS